MVATLAWVVLGCSPDAGSSEGRTDGPPQEPASVVIDRSRVTTEGDLALANLESMVEARLAQAPGFSSLAAVEGMGVILARTHYLGTYDDFVVVEGIVSRIADETIARTAQRKFDGAVHRYPAPEAGDPPLTADEQSVMAAARGMGMRKALAQAEAHAEITHSFAGYAAVAALQSELGEFVAADASFLQALDAYRDVSPFPVAWVQFQRGVMWSERAGRPDLGRALYEEAVRRLPRYVVANIHLSEMEFHGGEEAAAIARLERILPGSNEPELMAKLGTYLAKRDPARSAKLLAQAQARYETLLDLWPEAFADHAAEFYAGPGNAPMLALELALFNLHNRRSARAYQLALTRLDESDDDRLCAVRQEVKDAESRSTALDDLVVSLEAKCD